MKKERVLHWKVLLPSLRELFGQSSLQLSTFFRKLLLIFIKELVPLLFGGHSLSGSFAINLIDQRRNLEVALGVESELLFDSFAVVLL